MVILIIILLFILKNDILVFLGLAFILWTKFVYNKISLIINLLLLEIHIILNFFLLINFAFFRRGTLMIIFITISVCEAILGLGILIFTSRHKSSELILLD